MIDVVTGLACRNGMVLMALRLATATRPGMWEYPGGKVEDHEDPDQALIREWREELGVRIAVLRSIDTPLVLQLEQTYRIYLMTVSISNEPSALASQEIRWVDPALVITDLPLVPSSYWFYPAVMRIIRGTK